MHRGQDLRQDFRVHLSSDVQRFMSRKVTSLLADAPLRAVAECLARNDVSAVPLLEGGLPRRVISRLDLVRIGRREASGHGSGLLHLPARSASEVASHPVFRIGPADSVSLAAARMVKHRVHRLFVETDGVLVGVFSTRDLLRAVADHGVVTPLAAVMSARAFTVPAEATIAHATDRFLAAHASAVVVVDDAAWPLGIFGTREALASRDLPATTSVEDAMTPAILCMHGLAPLHRAAKLAAASSSRRILVIASRRRCIGVVAPLDVARAVGVH